MNEIDRRIDAAIAAREATGEAWYWGERQRLMQQVMDEYEQAVSPEEFDMTAHRSKYFGSAFGVTQAFHIQRRIILRLLDKLGA